MVGARASLVSGLAWTTDPAKPTDLLRLDISTDTITRFTVTSSQKARVVATLGDRAVIGIDEPSRQLLTTDGVTRTAFLTPENRPPANAFASRPGLWVSLSGGGLALSVNSGPLELVSSVDVFAIAGGCW
jgi:hypothetical protein